MGQTKKDIGYIFLILGTTIGAGLASGQEIVLFFAQYGFVSILFVILFAIIFAISIKILLNYGNLMQKNANFNKKYKNEYIFESASGIIFLIFSSIMLAGAESLLNQIAIFSRFHLWSILILLLCFFAVLKGLKWLININFYLIPLIVLSTLLVCCFSFNYSPHSPAVFSFDISNFAFLSVSTILYSCCNIMVSSKILIKIGTKIEEKSIKKVSFFTSLLLSTIIIFIIVALLINDNSLIFAELPMVYLAFIISDLSGYLYSFIILICIITTLLSTFFSLKESIKTKIKSNIISTIIAFFAILLLSLFGFENIVRYSYPVIGALGLILIFNLQNRINYSKCECQF